MATARMATNAQLQFRVTTREKGVWCLSVWLKGNVTERQRYVVMRKVGRMMEHHFSVTTVKYGMGTKARPMETKGHLRQIDLFDIYNKMTEIIWSLETCQRIPNITVLSASKAILVDEIVERSSIFEFDSAKSAQTTQDHELVVSQMEKLTCEAGECKAIEKVVIRFEQSFMRMSRISLYVDISGDIDEELRKEIRAQLEEDTQQYSWEWVKYACNDDGTPSKTRTIVYQQNEDQPWFDDAIDALARRYNGIVRYSLYGDEKDYVEFHVERSPKFYDSVMIDFLLYKDWARQLCEGVTPLITEAFTQAGWEQPYPLILIFIYYKQTPSTCTSEEILDKIEWAEINESNPLSQSDLLRIRHLSASLKSE